MTLWLSDLLLDLANTLRHWANALADPTHNKMRFAEEIRRRVQTDYVPHYGTTAQFIQAVKLIRMDTGWSLRDSKQFADTYLSDLKSQ